jgi:hypothetical protein
MKAIEVKVRGVGVVEPKVRRGYLEFLCVYPGFAPASIEFQETLKYYGSRSFPLKQ